MGYYVPNKVKPVCYNCPYRTNKYCGLLTEHDYLGDYPFNFEPYPYCPLIEVTDRKTEPQYDFSEYADRLWRIAYERGKREALAKDEPQTCSVNGRPYDCGNCEYHKCMADEPQTERESEVEA